jgi:hypothetical protein
VIILFPFFRFQFPSGFIIRNHRWEFDLFKCSAETEWFPGSAGPGLALTNRGREWSSKGSLPCVLHTASGLDMLMVLVTTAGGLKRLLQCYSASTMQNESRWTHTRVCSAPVDSCWPVNPLGWGKTTCQLCWPSPSDCVWCSDCNILYNVCCQLEVVLVTRSIYCSCIS